MTEDRMPKRPRNPSQRLNLIRMASSKHQDVRFDRPDFSKIIEAEPCSNRENETTQIELYRAGYTLLLAHVSTTPVKTFKKLFPTHKVCYAFGNRLYETCSSSGTFGQPSPGSLDLDLDIGLILSAVPREKGQHLYPLSTTMRRELPAFFELCERQNDLTTGVIDYNIGHLPNFYTGDSWLADQDEYDKALLRNALYVLKDKMNSK